MRRPVLIAFATCLLLAARPSADGPPTAAAALQSGDSFLGVIDHAWDSDEVTFAAVAGDHIKVVVTAMPGSALRPDPSLYIEDYGVGDAKLKGNTASIKLTTDVSATLRLYIHGDDQTTGGYKVVVKVRPGKFGKRGTTFPSVTDPGALGVYFVALPDSTLDLRVRPAHGTQALPGLPTVLGPGGFDLGSALEAKGSKLVVDDLLLLPGFHAYVLLFPNVGGPGELKAKARIRRPKLLPQTWFEQS